MKRVLVFVLLITFYLLLITPAHADYVLPYPSFLPGNKIYTVSRIIDKVKGFWYFGTIAQVKYHLGLSDKYLVEAKTLFEYKQYLLASDAMTRSDTELIDLPGLLRQGQKGNEDMSQLVELVREALNAHQMVIAKLKGELPKDFTWTPEKKVGTTIHIDDILTTSAKTREQISSEVKKF